VARPHNSLREISGGDLPSVEEPGSRKIKVPGGNFDPAATVAAEATSMLPRFKR
jgi:hypothetical protein